MARFANSLRWKVLAVLTLVALVPALVLGLLGVVAVRSLGGLAREKARLALQQEYRQRLLTRVQEDARADDALFEGVRSEALTLAHYVAWYYDHPQNLPSPGYLTGGSNLVKTPAGHWVNAPDTPVGVFASRRDGIPDWYDLGIQSFADPLMASILESTPGAERVWLISANDVVRIYPNLKLGHPGSQVGPDYHLTDTELFQAAAPQRNPSHQRVWTAPYIDPVTHRLTITAAAPVYTASGEFRAVAAVDMPLDGVVASVLQTQPEPGRSVFLLDRDGNVISASAEARIDLGLPAGGEQQPGQAVETPLSASTLAAVRSLADPMRGARGPDLRTFAGSAGRRYVGFAPLPSTGWVLGLLAPAEQVEGASTAVEAGITHLEYLFLAGGTVGLVLVVLLVYGLAARASTALTRPVGQLLEGTGRLAGDLSYRLPDMGADELGQLAGSFNAMAATIERSRDEAVHHARMVVDERNRLAREIHDTIAQGLTGVVVHLETSESYLGDKGSPEAVKHLRRARELARESLQEARRSVWNLRPGAVAAEGLAPALRALCAGLEQDGIACDVTAEPVSVAEAAEDALFRVCQEALANVRRHSGATSVAVTLHNEGGCAVLQVSDNGCGFDPAELSGPRPGGGFGLWSMRERLAGSGGDLAVDSRPGRGTTVRAWVPVGGR